MRSILPLAVLALVACGPQYIRNAAGQNVRELVASYGQPVSSRYWNGDADLVTWYITEVDRSGQYAAAFANFANGLAASGQPSETSTTTGSARVVGGQVVYQEATETTRPQAPAYTPDPGPRYVTRILRAVVRNVDGTVVSTAVR